MLAMEAAACYRLRSSRKRPLSPLPVDDHTAKRPKPEATELSGEGERSGCVTQPTAFGTMQTAVVDRGQRLTDEVMIPRANPDLRRPTSLNPLLVGAPMPVTPPPNQPSSSASSVTTKGEMVMAASLRQSQACEEDLSSFSEIKEQLLVKESKYVVDPYYMSRHQDLNWGMRAILIDWLTEVCGLHMLTRQTLHQCVIIFDRYMSRTQDITPDRLQLIGCACLFIAAKFEEVSMPMAAHLAYLTEGGCTAQEILQCEDTILRVLNFEITPPTPNTWADLLVEQIIQKPNKHLSVHQLRSILILQVMQVIDLAILDRRSLNYPPHLLAAAACCACGHYGDLAEKLLGIAWSVLTQCTDWLSFFVQVVSQDVAVTSTLNETRPNHLQRHIRGLALLESVDKLRREQQSTLLTPDPEDDDALLSLCDSDDGPLTPTSD